MLNCSSVFKQWYFIVSIAIFAPLYLEAQTEATATPQVTDTTGSYITGDEIFNDIKIGVIIPQGTFAQPVSTFAISANTFNNFTLPFKGMEGLGATYGYNLQYEGFSSFWKTKKHGTGVKVHFGLQYGFDFGYIPLSWNNITWSNYSLNVGTAPFLYTGLKFGLGFYVSPVKDLGIGVYALIDPFLVAPGGENAAYNYTDGGGTTTIASYVIKDGSSIQGNIDASAGINLYFKPIIIGVEYNWVHTKYNGSVSEYVTETNGSGSTSVPTTSSFTNLLQMNLVKLTLGIRLGYKCKYRNMPDAEN